jgi:hypothetical protein
MIVMTGPLEKALWWTSSKENWKNILLKLWSRETAIRILEDFREPTFIDDATMVGPDRLIIYVMVDCHDEWMIPLGTSARRGIWEEVFVIVVNWTSIDGPLELAENYLYWRTG